MIQITDMWKFVCWMLIFQANISYNDLASVITYFITFMFFVL